MGSLVASIGHSAPVEGVVEKRDFLHSELLAGNAGGYLAGLCSAVIGSENSGGGSLARGRHFRKIDGFFSALVVFVVGWGASLFEPRPDPDQQRGLVLGK